MDEDRSAGSGGGSGRAEGAEAAGPHRIEAEALLGGRREVLIAHGSELYRLRLTSNNKLILTK